MKNIKELRNNYFFVFVLFGVALLIFALSIQIKLTGDVVLEEKKIPASLTIGNQTGFDLNNTVLTFGMIISGSSGSRKLELVNDYDFPVKYLFSAEGDIKEFINFEEEIVLQPGEKKEVGIATKIIEDEPFGNYTGNLIVQVKKDV